MPAHRPATLLALLALASIAVAVAAPLAQAQPGGAPASIVAIPDATEIVVPREGAATLHYTVLNRGAEPVITQLKLVFLGEPVPGAPPPLPSTLEYAGTVEPSRLALAPGSYANVTVNLTLATDEPAPGMVALAFQFPGSETRLLTGNVAVSAAPASTEGLLALAREHPAAAAGLVAGGVSAFAALAIARRETARFAALAAVLPLYTRLARQDVLDHATRERVHAAIVSEPGVNYSKLKRGTGLAAGVLVHHLRTLERHGLVRTRREGALRRYWAAGAEVPPPPALTAAEARVVDALRGGAVTQRAVADALGVTQQGASFHLRNLERKGLVAARFEEGEWRYGPRGG